MSSSYDGEPRLSATGMTGLVWFLVTVTTLCVISRTWIRIWVKGSLAWDDYWVFLAYILLFVMSASYTVAIPTIYNLYAVAAGTIPPPANFVDDVESYLKLQFGIIILFWCCVWSVKASFLAVYKGIIDKRLNPWKLRAWWAICIICALSFVGCIATQLRSCEPLHTYFEINGCESPQDLYVSNLSLYYSSGVDVACDLLIMALPLSILWNLQLNGKSKLGLAGLFSAGGLIIAFAILRLVKTNPNFGAHVDAKWLCIMSQTETAVAVIVSSTPAFRMFFVKRGANSQPSGRSQSSRVQQTLSSIRDPKDGDIKKEVTVEVSWEMQPIPEEAFPEASRTKPLPPLQSSDDRIYLQQKPSDEGVYRHRFWEEPV